MSLPATGLTLHTNASVIDDIWNTNSAGVFSVHPNPGIHEDISFWDDEEHGANSWVLAADAVSWRSLDPVLMEKPCLEFDGATGAMKAEDDVSGADKAASAFISASAFTLYVSFYLQGGISNDADTYDNILLIGDGAGYFGLYISKPSGYKLLGYNWDGNDDHVDADISLNTSYVARLRHDGGNLYLSINGGAETSVASGDTESLIGTLRLARRVGTEALNARIGEVALYNVSLAGADLAEADAHFATWLPAEEESSSSSEEVVESQEENPIVIEDKLLLPGFGGKVIQTVRAVDADPAAVSGEVDCSRVVSLTISIKSQTGGGEFSIQPKQSFDGVNWVDFGAPLTAVNERVNYDFTDAPFGLLRFEAVFDDSDSAPSSSSSSWAGPFSSDIEIELIGWQMPIPQ